MADNADNSFRAAIHALREIVAPAVDPANPLATEQLQLVIAWLEFQRQRLPHAHDRHRAELSVYMKIAETAAGAAGSHGAALQPAIGAAAKTLESPSAGFPELRSATQRLELGVAELVRTAPDMPAEAQAELERAVVRAMKGFLDIERVWFQPMGVEATSKALPQLHDVLGVSSDDGRS